MSRATIRCLARPGVLLPRPGSGPTIWLASLGMVAASGLAAQEAPNPLLTFSLSQGVQLERNPDLDPGSDETRARLTTDLGLLFISQTPISSLTLSADSALGLALESEEDDDGLTVDQPELAFSYQRAVPSASFTLDGRYRRDDISFLRDLADFVDDDGNIDLPDDLLDLQGEGTRQEARIDAVLTLRDDRPFGAELSAGIATTDYQDVTSEELADITRADLGVALRFDLSEVARIRAGIGASYKDEDGVDPVTRLSFDLDGSIDRPDGQLFANLRLFETEDGVDASLSFGRNLERPLGGLSASLGVTRDDEGELALFGSLEASRTLPNGSAALAIEQSVDVDDDEETVATTLTAGWSREITPLLGLNLETVYTDLRTEDDSEGLRILELGASLDRQITRDWSLGLAYRHLLRDERDEARAEGDSLALTLSRSFGTGL